MQALKSNPGPRLPPPPPSHILDTHPGSLHSLEWVARGEMLITKALALAEAAPSSWFQSDPQLQIPKQEQPLVWFGNHCKQPGEGGYNDLRAQHSYRTCPLHEETRTPTTPCVWQANKGPGLIIAPHWHWEVVHFHHRSLFLNQDHLTCAK